MDVKGQAVCIKRRSGRRYSLYFDTKQERAEAVEKINDAVRRAG